MKRPNLFFIWPKELAAIAEQDYDIFMTLRIKKISLISAITTYIVTMSVSAAPVLSCTFNKMADAKSLTASQIKEHTKSFIYNVDKEVGKNIALDPYKLIIWKKSPHMNVKFMGGDLKEPLTIQFSEKQENLLFQYGKKINFKCQSKGMTEAQKATSLTSEKNIDQFQENVVFTTTQNLVFPYYQPEESQRMRTLYFQNGKIFKESTSMEQKMPWCSLRVQLKRDEDTTVKSGEVFVPVSFQKQENNNYFTTFSYSFVDFSKGKKVGEKHLYSPFMLNCNILRGMPYKLSTWQSVVGPYLNIKASL